MFLFSRPSSGARTVLSAASARRRGTLKIQNTRAGEPAMPPDPPKALKETARAWEVFVGSGEFIGTPPRPVIAQSWQRCRDLGINPFMERAPTVLGPDEIEAILGGEDFGQAGKQGLDTFAQVVAGQRDGRPTGGAPGLTGRYLRCTGAEPRLGRGEPRGWWGWE